MQSLRLRVYMQRFQNNNYCAVLIGEPLLKNII